MTTCENRYSIYVWGKLQQCTLKASKACPMATESPEHETNESDVYYLKFYQSSVESESGHWHE